MGLSTPTGANILRYWNKLATVPAGKYLFSKFLGIGIPYTGSMGARIQSLAVGHAVVQLRDRRKVRNHLNSVHAIALANLAELTSGLATLCGMPDTARGILTGFEIEYLKKSRGTITGECRCDIPATDERTEYLVQVDLTDKSGDIVAIAHAKWLIGPIEKQTQSTVSATNNTSGA